MDTNKMIRIEKRLKKLEKEVELMKGMTAFWLIVTWVVIIICLVVF